MHDDSMADFVSLGGEPMVLPGLKVRRPRGSWFLAVLLVLLNLVPLRTGQPTPGPTSAWADAAALAFAIGSGIPLLWYRRYPVAVTGCVVACYAGLGVVVGLVPPYAPWVVIALVATEGSGRRRSTRLALAAAGATCLIVGAAELARPGVGASALLVFITVVVALVAVLLRSERGRLDAVRERATTQERLRIARDLHDLVGHGLSTVAVQSSTARMALDAGDVATARTAVSAVESTSRIAMREMRQMLGVLTDLNGSDTNRTDIGANDSNGSNRGESEGSRTRPSLAAGSNTGQVVRPPPHGTESSSPAPGLGDVGLLVENVGAAGVVVTLETAGKLDGLPADLQLCAYRVLQEGLTNAVKHAPGATVHVRIFTADRLLHAAVESTGGVSGQGEEGSALGLSGLRSRVAALSGELVAGPTKDGWLLEARLPLQPPGWTLR
jgi:signal transduction histidine kinase